MAYADKYQENSIVANTSSATVQVTKAEDVFTPTLITPKAVGASKSAATTVDCSFKDERTVIYVDAACTLVILAGNGYAGVKDVTMTFSGAGFFTVDSARIKNMKEEDGFPRGQFKVYASSGTPKIAVLEG